ncbi:hypothetical protein BGX34_012107, partial [Mortierella sp. NVP85]
MSKIKIESGLGWIPTKLRQQTVASATQQATSILHVRLESRLNGTRVGPNTRLANRL